MHATLCMNSHSAHSLSFLNCCRQMTAGRFIVDYLIPRQDMLYINICTLTTDTQMGERAEKRTSCLPVCNRNPYSESHLNIIISGFSLFLKNMIGPVDNIYCLLLWWCLLFWKGSNWKDKAGFKHLIVSLWWAAQYAEWMIIKCPWKGNGQLAPCVLSIGDSSSSLDEALAILYD